jgi:hypothetical protein
MENSDVCAHCGQPMPTAGATYGDRRPRRTGLIVTVLLHLLLVAIYLFNPHKKEKHGAPPSGETITYVAPLPPGKPKPKLREQAPKKTVKAPSKPERTKVERLPNTITLPDEKPVEVAQAEPKKVEPAPPEMDMSAAIEARRRQRGAQVQSDQPAEESENDRANRLIRENVAAANARGRSDDAAGNEATVGVMNKTFHSADLKFNLWNPNFKRRWLSVLKVEVTTEPDIETAVVNKMVETIRKMASGDFQFDSQRLHRKVTLSARPEDTAELKSFLFKEFFPEYKPAQR